MEKRGCSVTLLQLPGRFDQRAGDPRPQARKQLLVCDLSDEPDQLQRQSFGRAGQLQLAQTVAQGLDQPLPADRLAEGHLPLPRTVVLDQDVQADLTDVAIAELWAVEGEQDELPESDEQHFAARDR